MPQARASPIFAQLRSAKSLSEQTAGLKALKNEIVGHYPKKEAWIGLGVLEPIISVLSAGAAPARANGKDARHVPRPLSEEETVKLQALHIVASFAIGGPAFLAPLHAAEAIPAIIDNISPLTNPPQVVVAALRALVDITSAAALASPSAPLNATVLADSLFTIDHIESLISLLSAPSLGNHFESQATLSIDLIRYLCREERHRQALTAAGVLDVLASKLAGFVVADGLALPGSEHAARANGFYEAYPEAVPRNARLGPVLDAIHAMLGDSKYRACRLVHSPAILCVFPIAERTPTREQDRPPKSEIDCLLADLPRFPAQGSSSNSVSPERNGLERRSSQPGQGSPAVDQRIFDSAAGDDDEGFSPLMSWLILVVQSLPATTNRRVQKNWQEIDRLMAAEVLADLSRIWEKLPRNIRTRREYGVSYLVLPILLRMIATHEETSSERERSGDLSQVVVLERAPAIVARLIMDNERLQAQAFDCNAVRVITKCLKRAYTPAQPLMARGYWSPTDSSMEVEPSDPIACLGHPGEDFILVHRVRLRGATLSAVAALASGKEQYRKALVNEGIVPCVVESLSEHPKQPQAGLGANTQTASSVAATPSPQFGTNSVLVIVAACHAIRTLARSIKVLRTQMVDNDVRTPIIRFLEHSNVDVQIAATAAVCNLVVDVSPVRDYLVEHGITRILVQHARSDHLVLRLNAFWALKHLVHASSSELKKEILQQLDLEFLVQVIQGDAVDGPARDPRIKEEPDLDDDVDMSASEGPVRWLVMKHGSAHEFDTSHSSQLRRTEQKLLSLRDAEINPAKRALKDDVAIQEQALGLMRNLFGQPAQGLASESAAEMAEMIDHLLSTLGKDRFFELLASKIRHKVQNAYSRRGPSAGGEPKVIFPPSRIVASVVYILVHIAGSIPRHRQLVVSQGEVLKLLVNQCNSRDREVRIGLCHLVNNLTTRDDGVEESLAWADRVNELKRFGYHTRLEILSYKDIDLDVRERAKLAVSQIDQATFETRPYGFNPGGPSQ